MAFEFGEIDPAIIVFIGVVAVAVLFFIINRRTAKFEVPKKISNKFSAKIPIRLRYGGIGSDSYDTGVDEYEESANPDYIVNVKCSNGLFFSKIKTNGIFSNLKYPERISRTDLSGDCRVFMCNLSCSDVPTSWLHPTPIDSAQEILKGRERMKREVEKEWKQGIELKEIKKREQLEEEGG